MCLSGRQRPARIGYSAEMLLARSFVGICLFTVTAAAQSPRAGGPAPGDDQTARIGVDFGIAGNLARGFVDRDLISARGVIQGWDGPWGAYVQPYWLYGRVGVPMMGKVTTDNEIYVRNGVFRALTERSVDIVKEIYDSLRPACVASRDNKTIGENMIMNAAFLLQRKKEPEFDRIVNQISERFKNILSFRYSGPWPPYNFVNIRLKLEGAS